MVAVRTLTRSVAIVQRSKNVKREVLEFIANKGRHLKLFDPGTNTLTRQISCSRTSDGNLVCRFANDVGQRY